MTFSKFFLLPKIYFVILIFNFFNFPFLFNFWFFRLIFAIWSIYRGSFYRLYDVIFRLFDFIVFLKVLIFLKNKNRNSTYVEKIDFQKIRNVKNRFYPCNKKSEIGDLLKEKIDILSQLFDFSIFLNVRFFCLFDFYQQSAFVELIRKNIECNLKNLTSRKNMKKYNW